MIRSEKVIQKIEEQFKEKEKGLLIKAKAIEEKNR